MYEIVKMFLAQNISVAEISKKFPQVKKSLLYKYLRIYNLEKFKSEPKNALFHSKEWHDLKERALKRDNYKCTKCGHKGSFRNPLQLEHKLPRSLYPELTWDLNNVIILCLKDHKNTLTFGKAKIRQYAKKLKMTKSKKKQ